MDTGLSEDSLKEFVFALCVHLDGVASWQGSLRPKKNLRHIATHLGAFLRPDDAGISNQQN